ncbi:hypothetical protein ml_77 [Mollivirus sibericum]|uniref:hypothetical protein n=1 Tax=Mollivirus sibericum TaxID=1678078 RepID=UPI0006B2EF6C|nr:hypothetical protein ml_77 [Mollivirus sibericum]ALD61879.1 hypothetical protein ml_77 [Mollivirus sibericum]
MKRKYEPAESSTLEEEVVVIDFATNANVTGCLSLQPDGPHRESLILARDSRLTDLADPEAPDDVVNVAYLSRARGPKGRRGPPGPEGQVMPANFAMHPLRHEVRDLYGDAATSSELVVGGCWGVNGDTAWVRFNIHKAASGRRAKGAILVPLEVPISSGAAGPIHGVVRWIGDQDFSQDNNIISSAGLVALPGDSYFTVSYERGDTLPTRLCLCGFLLYPIVSCPSAAVHDEEKRQ